MRHITYLFLLFLFQPSMEAKAQGSPVLVELFTSQGCSACPQIDEAFGSLTRRPDVIALTLHVDYWDYLGWADEFATEANTRRQRAYAEAHSRRTLYTPQLLINGRPLPMGAGLSEVELEIGVRERERSPADLRVVREGAFFAVAVVPAGPKGAPADVHVVLFEPARTAEIGGGENAGRSITYYNVVTNWRTVARWNGREPAKFRVAVPSGRPAAVIVQRQGAGPVLAARRLQ